MVRAVEDSWSADGNSWSQPTDILWLMGDNHEIIEQLDLKSGIAEWTFATAGTYRYCSGGCWDPPDWGVIHFK